jgi:hypothetical protein
MWSLFSSNVAPLTNREIAKNNGWAWSSFDFTSTFYDTVGSPSPTGPAPRVFNSERWATTQPENYEFIHNKELSYLIEDAYKCSSRDVIVLGNRGLETYFDRSVPVTGDARKQFTRVGLFRDFQKEFSRLTGKTFFDVSEILVRK